VLHVVHLERAECKELVRSRDFGGRAKELDVQILLYMDSSVQ
jgi:hypothetical protein